MNTKKIGSFGEEVACRYLKGKRYKILERNYSKNWSAVKKGEIDIICKKEDVISFVEVKTIRQSFGRQEIPPLERQDFLPEEKVDFRKRRKLIKLAQSWLTENKIPLESKWQIDIIAIKVDLNVKKAKINHFRNAVS